jgi:hypothetical protein
MAKEGSNILEYILLGVGGFVIYEMFFATPAATTTPAVPVVPATTPAPVTTANTTTNTTTATQSTTPATPAVPVQTVPAAWASIVTLLTAAGGAGPLTADQWSYYYNIIQTTPTSATMMDNILTNLGFSQANRGGPITAQQFVNALATATGMSGLGGLGRVYVSGFHGPMVVKGLGTIGAGYGINALHGSDASYWERAFKYNL